MCVNLAAWLAHENAVFDIAWMPGEPQLVSANSFCLVRELQKVRCFCVTLKCMTHVIASALPGITDFCCSLFCWNPLKTLKPFHIILWSSVISSGNCCG